MNKCKALRRAKFCLSVSYWDDQEKEMSTSLEEFEEMNLAKERYWSLLEEVSWRQNSRKL